MSGKVSGTHKFAKRFPLTQHCQYILPDDTRCPEIYTYKVFYAGKMRRLCPRHHRKVYETMHGEPYSETWGSRPSELADAISDVRAATHDMDRYLIDKNYDGLLDCYDRTNKLLFRVLSHKKLEDARYRQRRKRWGEK